MNPTEATELRPQHDHGEAIAGFRLGIKTADILYTYSYNHQDWAV